MRENETEEQTKLIKAISVVLSAVSPDKKNISSFATLIVYGPTHMMHGMVLSTFMDKDHPAHDLAYELWRLRATFNAYWKNRSATAG